MTQQPWLYEEAKSCVVETTASAVDSVIWILSRMLVTSLRSCKNVYTISDRIDDRFFYFLDECYMGGFSASSRQSSVFINFFFLLVGCVGDRRLGEARLVTWDGKNEVLTNFGPKVYIAGVMRTGEERNGIPRASAIRRWWKVVLGPTCCWWPESNSNHKIVGQSWSSSDSPDTRILPAAPRSGCSSASTSASERSWKPPSHGGDWRRHDPGVD